VKVVGHGNGSRGWFVTDGFRNVLNYVQRPRYILRWEHFEHLRILQVSKVSLKKYVIVVLSLHSFSKLLNTLI